MPLRDAQEAASHADPRSTMRARVSLDRHATYKRTALGTPIICGIEVAGDAMELIGGGLTVIAYAAAISSEAQQQVKLLTSLSATAGRESSLWRVRR